MDRKTVNLLALSALLVLPLAGEVTRSEMISYDSLRDVSFRKELIHEFSEKPGTVRVSADVRLKKGELSFRLEAPEGEVVWQESLRARTRVELVKEFPGEIGAWRIVLDAEKAAGRYHLKLEQAN